MGRRPSAKLQTILGGIDVNFVNVADRQRLNAGDRIIEVHAPEVKATAMVLTRVEDGTLVVHVYDTAGPVEVRT